jgi:pimeloyl-ACP methyl ester carboxylesterase
VEAGGHPAILLPGSVLPAGLAYAALVEALGDAVDVRPKDLDLYREDSPPPGYTLAVGVDGVRREADAAGVDRFHLVGYSAGGSAALAFAAKRPDRLLSLTLLEPAWIGWADLSPGEREFWQGIAAARELPPDRFMEAFVRLQLRPGVEPPPPPDEPPAPWMAKRPAGIRALTAAFEAGDIDHGALGRFERPVFHVFGGKSNPDAFERPALRLERVFPDFALEIFRERHAGKRKRRIATAIRRYDKCQRCQCA